ncbi:glutaredoxin family protein [[Phormidium] sp. ETS-05]|uniref:glutaredoxin family protein n=1 Tax=[Phormidium] sp. ETS-05 TaxID=222819 RepID=UPI0018EF04CD|nr:glutaredoxin family protein [[Phormidium] sp. ETS-05]
MRLILYSKPGCHLCEGLLEKLEQVRSLSLEVEVRDITTVEDWFQAYQYEVPVLCQESISGEGVQEQRLPRISPRASVAQVEQMLSKFFPPP